MQGYAGYLVRDDYAGWHQFDTQLAGVGQCAAHLIRHCKGVLELHPTQQKSNSTAFTTASTLDAYSHCDDVDDILGTFSIVNCTDGQCDGEYCTKQLILDIYNGMATAIETGQSPAPRRQLPQPITESDRLDHITIRRQIDSAASSTNTTMPSEQHR